MHSVQEAAALILNLVQPLDGQEDQEVVDLLAAGDRILAAETRSDRDFPYWDNAAMDGYAVRHRDVQATSDQEPVVLEIIEEIPAGHQPQQTVQPGQAARIFTGAVMPSGADTVVMQEQTQRQGNQVQIFTAPEPQAFVRHQGAYYRAGDPLLPPGIRLQAPELAILATAQCTQIPVYRRPVVAILSTGNELVAPDQPLQPGQIVDSNQYALAHLVAQTGAIPIRRGILGDTPEALKAAIAEAVQTADLVISSGGVSVGDYDYVDRVLAELGAEIPIQAVAVKPGKPLTVAIFPPSRGLAQKKLYFGLPGNPVSVLVSFWRFVQPALRKLSGLSAGWQPVFVTATALQDLRSDGKRETYLWGQLQQVADGYGFKLAAGSHSSGNLINLVQTNGLAMIPVGESLIAVGNSVQVLKLNGC
jgi:molybdopterin molybdotransferase